MNLRLPTSIDRCPRAPKELSNEPELYLKEKDKRKGALLLSGGREKRDFDVLSRYKTFLWILTGRQ
jgi:hypothetical protein